MLRFGLFGFPVTIHWTFWLVAALLSGQLTNPSSDALPLLLAWIVAVLISILWHELGHAFAFKRFGRHSEIELHTFGGVARSRGGGLTRYESAFVSVAGPAAGLLLWLVLHLVLFETGRIHFHPKIEGMFVKDFRLLPHWFEIQVPTLFLKKLLGSMLWINFLWSIINLFPVYPLDGGQIFAAMSGNTQKALQVSVVTGIGLALAGLLFFGSVFMAIMFGMLAFQSYQRLKGLPTGFRPFG